MRAFIGLGANLGDRLFTLERAAQALRHLGTVRLSPVYENPAMVPAGAPIEWRIPFLNAVAELAWSADAPSLLAELKRIERELGRTDGPRWSPRAIDLDLLTLAESRQQSAVLTLPHRDLWERSFVLDPLKDLVPSYIPPDQTETVLSRARTRPGHAPLWMGIMNLTPDSFSDGGQLLDPGALEQRIELFASSGTQIIDLGGESTRPGATAVDATEEWARVASALQLVRERFAGRLLRPLISVDTRRAATARRALEAGADWINDVSGLADPEMASVLSQSRCDYVLMHSLSVPADRGLTLANDLDPVAAVKSWAQTKFNELAEAGVALDRIIFDPGVGFGKTPAQSLALIQRAAEFADMPVRAMFGHSRKSFMRLWTATSAAQNDLESVGVSLQLAQQGVDVLRVHEPQLHIRAHRAFQESTPWRHH